MGCKDWRFTPAASTISRQISCFVKDGSWGVCDGLQSVQSSFPPTEATRMYVSEISSCRFVFRISRYRTAASRRAGPLREPRLCRCGLSLTRYGGLFLERESVCVCACEFRVKAVRTSSKCEILEDIRSDRCTKVLRCSGPGAVVATVRDHAFGPNSLCVRNPH